ncbi:MAG: PadR family transcriptional regulator [Longimicrobiales bacterium]
MVDAANLYGNLNLLILRTLEAGPMHGLAIGRAIRSASEEVLQVEEGALYPALHRLERDGYLRAEWGVSERNRRAKYYALTASGRGLLEREIANWMRHTAAVSKVLDGAGA